MHGNTVPKNIQEGLKLPPLVNYREWAGWEIKVPSSEAENLPQRIVSESPGKNLDRNQSNKSIEDPNIKETGTQDRNERITQTEPSKLTCMPNEV